MRTGQLGNWKQDGRTMHLHKYLRRTLRRVAGVATLVIILLAAYAQRGSGPGTPSAPWMNSSLSPDERAALVVKEMTLVEKVSLLHGTGMAGLSPMSPLAEKSYSGPG